MSTFPSLLFGQIWVFCLNYWSVQGVIETHVSTDYIDGFFTYLPVRRSVLQERLDEINNQSAESDVKFFLPPKGMVFPDLLDCDQHVVMFVYGDVVATSFEESLTCDQKESFSTRFGSVNFQIPFLASSPEGPPKFALFLSRYISNKTEIIDPNFVLTPKIPADELQYTSNQSHFELSFTHGDKKLAILGEMSEPCHKPDDKVITDFAEFLDELHISQYPPDFSICDRLGDIEVDYCNAWRKYREDITKSGSNVCQFWTHSRNVTTCQLSIKVTQMSDEMKDMLALSHDEEPETIESEKQSGFYGIGLFTPCV